MKRYFTLLFVVSLAMFMMGMGELTSKPTGSIPMPDKNFKATITDINSIKTACSFVSINGKDLLKGKRGAASVSVPFEKIEKVTIRALSDEKEVEAKLLLRDGAEISIYVDSNADVYGKTDFGTVQIKIRDISTMQFSDKE